MGHFINGYPILPNGRTCNGNGTIVNINARTTYNNGMGNMGLFGAHNVRTNYAPTMDPYAFMAQQNACYDCGGGGGNKFMNAVMGVLGFLGIGGGIVAEVLGSKKEAKTDKPSADETTTQTAEQEKLQRKNEELAEEIKAKEAEAKKLEEENAKPTQPPISEEDGTKVEGETDDDETTVSPETEPKVDDKPAEDAKPVEDPEAAKKAKEAKEKAEAEALEKEGITKTKDGKYEMSYYNHVSGKIETVTANSVNEVKAEHKKGMQAVEYQKEQLMNEHGIQEHNGRYSYQFTVPYDKNIHSIEFTSLSLIDAVLDQAERIKNK